MDIKKFRKLMAFELLSIVGVIASIIICVLIPYDKIAVANGLFAIAAAIVLFCGGRTTLFLIRSR